MSDCMAVACTCLPWHFL